MPALNAEVPRSTKPGAVRLVVDGREYLAPPDSTVLEALDRLGVLMRDVEIPHYCWHPGLSVDGSCRLCQVEIDGMDGLQIACGTPVVDGMVVRTRTEAVKEAREGVMELLLLNHPLDCPICDQAGECRLQEYSWLYGSGQSRTREPRRALEKRVDLGPTIILDRERCILCRRCVRFCREVTETGELAVLGRADRSVIGCFPGAKLDNPYSMNVADVCPVGALTTKDFRFEIRVWQLTSTNGVCGGCARGCNIHIDVADGQIRRLRPRRNDHVNGSWICDSGRLSYRLVERPDRLDSALVRNEEGTLAERSIAGAIEEAAGRLGALATDKGGGVIAGIASAHATNEDLFVFRRFLDALGTESRGVCIPVGEADDLLIHHEKAPNAAGARALGFRDAAVLVERLRGGGLDGIVILGHDPLGEELVNLAELVGTLDPVVLVDTHQSALLRVADIVLPSSHLLEKSGTITNFEGRVQRIEGAVPPHCGAPSEGEIIARLGAAMGLDGFGVEFDWRAESRMLAESVPEFENAAYDLVPDSGTLLAPSDDGQAD